MSDQQLQPGELFVHFRIKRLLGEGGMGAVYEAEHEFTKRRTALKVIHTHRSKSGDFSDRMVQEARALADLSHPNVVVLHDANVTEDGLVWMATEYLEGETLREKRRRFHPLPVRDVLRYLIDACDGVAAAHDRGIIHRDLKPENIFVTNQGSLKVLDFGAAKVRDRGLINSTDIVSAGGQRRVIGTPEYMSPEHLNGLAVDERTDVYALGAIGYELLHQNPVCNPDGTFPQWIEICRRQIMVEPPPLSEVAPHLPAFLSPIFHRALAKQAEARHQRVADLAAELRAASRKCEETLVSGDRIPFQPRWVGAGAYVAHGPTFSPPEHEPVEVPSRQVVVAAPYVPALAATQPVGARDQGASLGTAPMMVPAARTALASAAEPAGLAGGAPRTSATPVFIAMSDVDATRGGAGAPHVSHTTEPATVHRAERAAQVRSRRRAFGAGLAVLGLAVVGIVVGAMALRSPVLDNEATVAADAGSAAVVAEVPAIPATEDAGSEAAPGAGEGGVDAGNDAEVGQGDAVPSIAGQSAPVVAAQSKGQSAIAPASQPRTPGPDKPATVRLPAAGELPFAAPKNKN